MKAKIAAVCLSLFFIVCFTSVNASNQVITDSGIKTFKVVQPAQVVDYDWCEFPWQDPPCHM